jgi:hypothetical protein
VSAPDWIAVHDGSSGWSSSGRTRGSLSGVERFFVDNIARAVTICESSDPDASYSYDDYALCELDGAFYLFNTSGCSCPSPNETWCVQWVADSKSAVIERIDLEAARKEPAYHAFVAALAAAWPDSISVPEYEGWRGDW